MLRSVIARRTSIGVARNQWPRSRRSRKRSCRAAATASALGRSLIGYWAASASGTGEPTWRFRSRRLGSAATPSLSSPTGEERT